MTLNELLIEMKEELVLNNNIDDDFEELEEGIRFFKASKRLEKLAKSLERKANRNPEVLSLVPKVRQAAKSFKTVEDSFANGTLTKAKAKAKLNTLKKQYSAIMKELRKKEIKDALKIAGIAAAVAGVIAAIVFGNRLISQMALMSGHNVIAGTAKLTQGNATVPKSAEIKLSSVTPTLRPKVSNELKQLEGVYSRSGFALKNLKQATKTAIFNRATASGL